METYIKAIASSGGTSLSTAKLMKTGQTTSYRTGDDGDIEAGRNTSFTVLAENNPFGNTNRFTDELGGQTYTKNIVIDWSTYDGSTVFGFRRTTTFNNWNGAIDGSLIVSIAPFTSGWRLPNIKELINLANYSLSQVFNYSPFNNTNALHSSTTDASNTANFFYANINGQMQSTGKTGTGYYIPCRTFTVTGTTLS